MQGKNLTQREAALIKIALEKENPSIFTNIFLKNKVGGRYVYPGSRRYENYDELCKKEGYKPFIARSGEIDFEVIPKPDEQTGQMLFWESRGFVLLKWALEFYRAKQKEKTVIGLTGTGKTLNIGAIALFMCAAYSNFKFINVAPTAKQSALMFQAIKEFIDDTEYREAFLLPAKQGIVESPYPQLRLRNGSRLIFFNIENNAGNIQGEWADWINGDEFGLLNGVDKTGQPILNTIGVGIATRLRGERPDGKPRLGWYSIISMAYDCDPLWERYDKGLSQSDVFWSKLVVHADNYYLTKEDIARVIRNAPPGLEGMWLRGERPPELGTEFSPEILKYLYSQEQMDDARKHTEDEDPNTRTIVTDSPYGVVEYQEPYVKGNIYLITGDPGTDEPPNRNAPTIMVWDVTDFPKNKSKLVAFWWGFGKGSILPFVDTFTELRKKYHVPYQLRGFDSTATQKYMSELVWMSEEEMVIPLGFDGSKKYQYINATKFLLSRSKLQIPAGITGIEKQIKRYRIPDNKLPQDIVATLGMACQLMFPLYISEYGEVDEAGQQTESMAGDFLEAHSRHTRQAGTNRYSRASNR